VAWYDVASKAPSISYIEGALHYCAQAGTLLGDDTPADATQVRKNIDSFSARGLSDFRRTIKQALDLDDKRSFDYEMPAT
jgi:hypothetical protein